MTKPKPRVERSCLACGVTFLGTPRATRCDDCRAQGRMVPREVQLTRGKNALTPEDIQLRARDAELRKLKAAFRAQEEELKVLRKASEATAQTRPPTPEEPSTDEEEQNPANETQAEPEADADEENESTEKPKRLTKWQREVLRIDFEYLGFSSWFPKPPGRLQKVKPENSNSALRTAWINLVAADGNIKAHSPFDTQEDVDEDTKLRMVTAFQRIRARGYPLDQMASICPTHLMGLKNINAAINLLPRVDLPTDDTVTTITPEEVEAGVNHAEALGIAV